MKDEILKRLEEIKEEQDKEIVELRTKLEELNARSEAPNFSKKEEELEKRNKAFDTYLRTGEKSEALEVRALVGGSTTGGFMVSPDFEARIIKASIELNNMRPAVRNRTTSSDTVITGSYADLTTVSWGNAAPAGENATGSQIQLDVKKLKVLVKVPLDAIEDSEADVVADVEELASRAFAVATREALTNGGANAISGFKSNATIQANAETSAVVGGLGSDAQAIDTFHKLIYSLSEEDASSESTYFVMSRTTLGVVSQIQDADGKYLYDATTNTIRGIPVIQNSSMDSIATGDFPIILGNFNEYSLYDRKGISITRLVEQYAGEGNLGLLFEARLAGGVTRTSAFKALVIA